MMKLSVLDQSPVRSGGTYEEALRETIELARTAERLGYHRYWVAEHHGSESFAGSAPVLLIGQLLAATDRIRVGSGGVMLMHYSPLKVAEQFRFLETLYPGRVDLGVPPQSHLQLVTVTVDLLAQVTPVGRVEASR